MKKLDKATMWTMLGLGSAVMAGAYWMYKGVYRKDKKLFDEAFNEFGFPRTEEDLRKFWQRARRQRIENAKEAQENKFLVEEAADFIKVSENLKKAYANLWDLNCDVQVAVWVLKSALVEWGKIFKLNLLVNNDPELDKFLDELLAAREKNFVEKIAQERGEGGRVPVPFPVSPLLHTSPPVLSPASDAALQCSFCAKTKGEAEKLIAGPSVYICNECVELCGDILDAAKKKENS